MIQTKIFDNLINATYEYVFSKSTVNFFVRCSRFSIALLGE